MHDFLKNTNGIVDTTDGNGPAAVAPYLSRRLNGIILDAVAYREAWCRHHPPRHSQNGPWQIDKPPFADGFNFTGNVEGFHHFQIVRTIPLSDKAWYVLVHFTYQCSSGCGMTGWKGIVVVKEEVGRYVIDDVLFPASSPEARGYRVSTGIAER